MVGPFVGAFAVTVINALKTQLEAVGKVSVSFAVDSLENPSLLAV